MLLSVVWELFTDVSGHPIGHNFEDQAVYKKIFLDCFTLEDDTESFPESSVM